jgi:hypothetical protein
MKNCDTSSGGKPNVKTGFTSRKVFVFVRCSVTKTDLQRNNIHLRFVVSTVVTMKNAEKWSGMLRRVALVRTDVSEEPGASFIRVTRIGELGTSNRRTLRINNHHLTARRN